MSIPLLGVIFLGLGIVGWLASERLFIATLAASAVFSTSAAFVVAGSGVAPFHVLGTLALASATHGSLRGTRTRHPATTILVLLVVWAVLVTAIAPAVFAGTPILEPRAGIDLQVYNPTPLTYTPSMAAQLAYLAVDVGVACYLVQRERLTQALVTVPMFLGTVLSAVHLVPAVGDALDEIFRNSPSAHYVSYTDRHPGVFAEPSYLAVFSITALAFTVYRFRWANGAERGALVAVLIVAPVNLVMSTSGTGALAFTILVCAALLYYGGRFLLGRIRLSPLWIIGFLVALAAVLTPNLTAGISEILYDKLDSDSFRHRFASDLFSIGLALRTFGLGVGLGANRSSSFVTLVLSNIGVVGLILLAIALGLVMTRVGRRPEWAPAAVALGTIVLTKAIAEPALSTPLLWFLIGVCMYAGRQECETPSKVAQAGRPPVALNVGLTHAT